MKMSLDKNGLCMFLFLTPQFASCKGKGGAAAERDKRPEPRSGDSRTASRAGRRSRDKEIVCETPREGPFRSRSAGIVLRLRNVGVRWSGPSIQGKRRFR